MKYKYSLSEATPFGWEWLKGWAYNSKEDFPNASAAYIEVSEDGDHGEIKNTKSDRIYYVIDGQGEFEINREYIGVKGSDVIIVPANTKYNYTAVCGPLKLFLVHTPAFDAQHDVKTEYADE